MGQKTGIAAFTHDDRTIRFLNLIDEYTRECLAIYVGRRINSSQVIDVLADVMIEHGIPEHIRSDNGPEFVAKELRKWLAKTGAKPLYIEQDAYYRCCWHRSTRLPQNACAVKAGAFE